MARSRSTPRRSAATAPAPGLLDRKGADYEMDVMMDEEAGEMRQRTKRDSATDFHQRPAHIGGSGELAGSGRPASSICSPSLAEAHRDVHRIPSRSDQTNVSNEIVEDVAFVREQARLARDAGADADAGGRPDRRQPHRDARRRSRGDARHAGCGAPAARPRVVRWSSIHVRVPGGSNPQPVLPDRFVGQHRRELRQDPHVRRQLAGGRLS